MEQTNDILLFFPELVAIAIILIATITVFNITNKLGVIFRKGFRFIGFGLAALAAGVAVDVFASFNLGGAAITEGIFEALVLTTTLFVLIGTRSIYSDISSKR